MLERWQWEATSHLLLGRISYRLASGAIHFMYSFFSTFFPVILAPQGTFILQYVLLIASFYHDARGDGTVQGNKNISGSCSYTRMAIQGGAGKLHKCIPTPETGMSPQCCFLLHGFPNSLWPLYIMELWLGRGGRAGGEERDSGLNWL